MKELLTRVKDNLTSSKLDLSIFISCVLVACLAITLLVVIIARDAAITNDVVVYESASPTDALMKETTIVPETTTQEETTAYSYSITQDGEIVEEPTMLESTIGRNNYWTDGNNVHYVEYNMIVKNVTGADIDTWAVVLTFNQSVGVSDSWGATMLSYGNKVDVKPVSYTEKIEAGKSVEIGFIISSSSYPYVILYSTKLGEKSEAIQIAADDITGETVAEKNETTVKAAIASYSTAVTTTQNYTTTKQTQTATVAASDTDYYQRYGSLRLSGSTIVDAHNQPFQIKGVSTHGINWYPEYVNREAFSSLNKLGVNTIRLAMYTNEYNGYCAGGDQASLKQIIANGVNYATELGMYAIIDWHILSDGNPNTHLDEAVTFFDEMSKKYAAHGNVLYEICNEPNGGVSWEDGTENDIKSYAETVISAIRANDSDAIIIVGTPTWSQDVDIVAADPLDTSAYTNIVYSLHFYAATHTDSIRAKYAAAHSQSLPILVTEFSICEASGNGSNDTFSGEKWLTLLDSNNIGYVAWNLSNKGESSSLIGSGCSKTSNFTLNDFSESGKWYFNQLAN